MMETMAVTKTFSWLKSQEYMQACNLNDCNFHATENSSSLFEETVALILADIIGTSNNLHFCTRSCNVRGNEKEDQLADLSIIEKEKKNTG